MPRNYGLTTKVIKSTKFRVLISNTFVCFVLFVVRIPVD